jgi:hypothetical protein
MRLNLQCAGVLCATALLGACAETTAGPGTPALRDGSGDGRSEVEIIDGITYTATWREGANTTVRLAYDSTVPVTDVRLIEIAETMTGCTATAETVEPSLVGGLAAVRVPVTCA